MELGPGAQLGQYRIVEQAGRGGMATVFKAYQPALERYVAIKVLPGFYAEDPSFLERFRQEARTVSQLRHPNILSVFDFGEQDGVTYMVGEFLPGGTLERLLGRPLSVGQAIELLRPIASALDYAHGRGMVHRDVKPSNILLAEDGTPVLSDFGVARIVAGATRLTATGVAVGTPAYMAPEQAAGDSTTSASDRYALGIVLFEMLTGRTPFQAETPVAVALAHIHKPLPLPRSLNPALPEAVEAVLLKALAKEPGERYESAAAMMAALAAAGGAGGPGGVWAGGPGGLGAEGQGGDGEAPTAILERGAVAPAEAVPVVRTATGRSNRAIGLGLLGAFVLLCGLAFLFIWWPTGDWTPAGRKEARKDATAGPAVAAPTAVAPAPGPTLGIPAVTAPQAVSPTTVPPPPTSALAPAAPAASPVARPGLAKPERGPLERLLPHLAGRLGAVVERDDFNDPNGGLFALPASVPNGRVAYENGSLVIEYARRAAGDSPVFGALASRPPILGNGVVDVEARLLGGPERGGPVIQVRRTASGGDGYYVSALPRQRAVTVFKEAGGSGVELGRAPAPGLAAEGGHRLTVVVDGPEIQVYVNGQSALVAHDDAFVTGQIGLGAVVGGPTSEVRVAFDGLRVVSLR
jgi:serine/threonine-protein kinase